MTRPGILVFASTALFAARTAHAYTPIQYREVAELGGKQVYAAATIEVSSNVWVFAGEPVSLGKCDKSTATIHRLDKTTVAGWQYSRCAIKASDNRSGTMLFGDLSRTPLKFNLRDPGSPAALRRAAFDEAFDTVLGMVSLAKAHGSELASDHVTSKLEGADVLGEYSAQWRAMNTAWENAKTIHSNLVSGSHYTTDSAMRDPKLKWAVKAHDPDMLRAWTNGAETPAERKRLDASSRCLGKLNGVGGWGTTPLEIADELERKQWRRGVTDVSAAQLAALDKENEDTLNKRLSTEQASFKKQLEQAQAMRKTLKW